MRRLIEWYKAFRRGEERTAPYPMTGRVYKRARPIGAFNTSVEPTVEMTARIIRKDGSIEEL